MLLEKLGAVFCKGINDTNFINTISKVFPTLRFETELGYKGT